MWIVTQHGFFNIIQYPEDRADDLLTIKARRRVDLIGVKERYEDAISREIEISDKADYRYRLKVPRKIAAHMIRATVMEIDYPKFKSRIMATPSQRDRHDIYLQVWDILHQLQETEHHDADTG